MRISGAESVVMEALWKRSPITSEDILAEVAEPQNWSEGTVRTLLNRLLNRGAVQAVREGRRYLYRPVLQRSDYVLAETTGLVDRLFGGRISPLVAQFSDHEKLSDEDISELKALIARIENA